MLADSKVHVYIPTPDGLVGLRQIVNAGTNGTVRQGGFAYGESSEGLNPVSYSNFIRESFSHDIGIAHSPWILTVGGDRQEEEKEINAGKSWHLAVYFSHLLYEAGTLAEVPKDKSRKMTERDYTFILTGEFFSESEKLQRKVTGVTGLDSKVQAFFDDLISEDTHHVEIKKQLGATHNDCGINHIVFVMPKVNFEELFEQRFSFSIADKHYTFDQSNDNSGCVSCHFNSLNVSFYGVKTIGHVVDLLPGSAKNSIAQVFSEIVSHGMGESYNGEKTNEQPVDDNNADNHSTGDTATKDHVSQDYPTFTEVPMEKGYFIAKYTAIGMGALTILCGVYYFYLVG